MNWTSSEGFTIDREIIDNKGTDAVWEKRFIVSIPSAVIAAIIGTLVIGSTSVIAATEIATSEAQRVVEEESARRVVDKENTLTNNIKLANVSTGLGKGLDTLNYKTTQGARTNNLYFDSSATSLKISHLLNDGKNGITPTHTLNYTRPA